MSLARAQAWLKKLGDDVTTATKLEWHLAYTEYLVGIGNLDKGLQYFDVAGQMASQDEDFELSKTSSNGSLKRVKVNRAIADAAYVSSLLAFEKVSIILSRLSATNLTAAGKRQRITRSRAPMYQA